MLQAIDSEGFEVEATALLGKIPIGGSGVLTDTALIKSEDFNRIYTWQQK